jgi:flagellar FliJ protein
MQHPSVQPLNTLLEHAERERDDALAQQQRAEAAMRGAENQVHQLLAYRGECERRWTERSRAGTTPTLMHCHQTFIGRLQTAVDMQGEVVKRAQAEVQRCREHLLALELRVASVRKLIERREAALAQQAGRSEQKMFDEIATRAAWNRLAGPAGRGLAGLS